MVENPPDGDAQNSGRTIKRDLPSNLIAVARLLAASRFSRNACVSAAPLCELAAIVQEHRYAETYAGDDAKVSACSHCCPRPCTAFAPCASHGLGRAGRLHTRLLAERRRHHVDGRRPGCRDSGAHHGLTASGRALRHWPLPLRNINTGPTQSSASSFAHMSDVVGPHVEGCCRLPR
jgi:hypothetical protein